MLHKTAAGHQVIKDRSVPLSPRQRAVLILVDGKRSRADVLQATAATGVTGEELDKLLELGLVEDNAAAPSTPVPSASAAPAPIAVVPSSGKSPQERYRSAYTIAVQLTGAMGLKGFRLNLAVEGAANYEELLAIAPKIRDAVGPEKFRALEAALNGD